jgi:anti-anti-sigma factor
VRIVQSVRDGCVVLTLTGRFDLPVMPEVRRALLEGLAGDPPTIICNLSGVEAIDPLCAAVFTRIRHPALGRHGTRLALCGARPAVVEVLTRLGVPRLVPLHETLDQALGHVRSRPPHVREQLGLVATLTAPRTARAFVRRVCRRWELEALVEPVELLASELVTNAVVDTRAPFELRLELRGRRLRVAVHDQDPRLMRILAPDDEGEASLSLLIIQKLARAWGVRRHPAGGKVVWCELETSERLA